MIILERFYQNQIVTRHPHQFTKGGANYNPLHSLSALKQKPDTLRQGEPVEITQRKINQTLGRIKRTKFPQQRNFAEFDFTQSPLDEAHIRLLWEGSYIKTKHNIILVGGHSWHRKNSLSNSPRITSGRAGL